MKPRNLRLTSCSFPHAIVGALCVLGAFAARTTAQTPTNKDSPDDAKHIVVEGQITNLIGSGLADADVVARRVAQDGKAGALIARTKTDRFGDFKIRTKRPVTGKIFVTVSKPQHATLTRTFNLDQDESGGNRNEFPPYLAEILRGDVRVEGRVVRANTEAPVKGASVVISAEDQEWTGETDTAGRFSIQGVPPGPGYVVVTAPGFGREQRSIKQLADAGEIELALQPGRTVKLIVQDDLGKPIPGVMIECFDEMHDDYRTAETGADGSLALKGLHIDTDALDVKLTHEEHVSDNALERSVLLPESKRNSEHVLIMPRAGKISGTVTDAATGHPLNGARVSTGTLDSSATPRDWSNYLGRYLVRGVPPGQTVVTVHLADHAPELRRVNVQAGVTATLDFKLKPAARIRGTVKNKEGEPVAGAYVDAGQWRGHETLGLRSVTGKDGRFVLENAPADEFEIRVSARGMKSLKVNVQAGAKPTDITLEVDPTAPTGEPAEKVKPGDAVPTLTLTALDGTKFDLTKFKGKTILLDFWATWCGPCVGELPHMMDVYKAFGQREDFVMIGISLDYDEKSLRDFVKKRGIGWSQVYGETGGSDAAADAFGVVGIPSVFIIDAQGKIGAMDLMGADLHDRITKILAASAKP